jgi:hypothetical protein
MSDSPNESQPPEVVGGALTPLDRFWLDATRNAVKESVGALEEAAKQLIAITSIAQTIYFAAISFSDLKRAVGLFTPVEQWLIAVVLAFPLLIWILSLVFAVRVFIPETYRANLNSPDLARETYYEIVSYKRRQLQRAHYLLVGGFVPLVLNVIVYVALVPVPMK